MNRSFLVYGTTLLRNRTMHRDFYSRKWKHVFTYNNADGKDCVDRFFDIRSESSRYLLPLPLLARKRRLSIVTKRKRVVVTGRGVAGCILINRGDIVPTNCHSRVSSAPRFIVQSWNASLKANSRTHFLDRGDGTRIFSIREFRVELIGTRVQGG